MKNKFRLSSSTYDRNEEDNRIPPKKVYFLAVEGTKTEKEYFHGISDYSRELNINALVRVHVLDHFSKDGLSAPKHVLELLDECRSIRNSKNDPVDQIPDSMQDIIQKYGDDFLDRVKNDPTAIPEHQRRKFYDELRKAGYDLGYLEFLRHYGKPSTNSEDYNSDVFCIIIDRDQHSHTKEQLESCIKYCKEKNYKCYISNPCFEFWLLLHYVDVKEVYQDDLDKFLENKKDTNRHTFTSQELSKYAHNKKKQIDFKDKYLPHVDEAIARAKKFPSETEDLIDHIGSNVFLLLEDMMNTPESN